MNINANIIETSHDLDALVRTARINPTENLIQKIIDKGLDYNANYVGTAESAYLWRKIFHIAA